MKKQLLIAVVALCISFHAVSPLIAASPISYSVARLHVQRSKRAPDSAEIVLKGVADGVLIGVGIVALCALSRGIYLEIDSRLHPTKYYESTYCGESNKVIQKLKRLSVKEIFFGIWK